MRRATRGRRETVEELALARALASCLEAMEGGETDLDALADHFPGLRVELRPLLEVAAALRGRRAEMPRADGVEREVWAMVKGRLEGGG